ncbi:hypothetical protein L2E82_24401 [Cichorium intybus]|uniref:Uncharacterized protein n=1 Tax=Cichorium intybus TaxID=13427 RepID=A0ACB9E0P6_CICIN|nr:hypothetical protein L2E82_24401 [Cichorium intybus]
MQSNRILFAKKQYTVIWVVLQLCFDLIQEWILANPAASICTPQEASDFKETAIFQDYHGLPEFRTAIAKLYSTMDDGMMEIGGFVSIPGVAFHD